MKRLNLSLRPSSHHCVFEALHLCRSRDPICQIWAVVDAAAMAVGAKGMDSKHVMEKFKEAGALIMVGLGGDSPTVDEYIRKLYR